MLAGAELVLYLTAQAQAGMGERIPCKREKRQTSTSVKGQSSDKRPVQSSCGGGKVHGPVDVLLHMKKKSGNERAMVCRGTPAQILKKKNVWCK